MTLKEKLNVFREKINRATAFDNSFEQLLGIELYDFIHANNVLKNEFYRRVNYLKNLAEDKDFKLLQDNLFQVVQKILKLTSLQEAQARQKEWNRVLINKLKTRWGRQKKGKREKEKIDLTLPELYLALQKKNSYYRLGDNSYFSPLEGEISIRTHIVPIKKQYEVNVEQFFKIVFSDRFTNDKKGEKTRTQFDSLIKEYNDYWYKLDELIYRIPIQLHLQAFEKFFFDCTEFHPREGYEFHYDFLSSASNRKTERRFREVKKNALVVIDDLIDVVEEHDEPPKLQPQENHLKSLHLVAHSLEPKDVIFLVLDGLYDKPIRCSVKNKSGYPTYIKKLYDIAYIVNVPGKRVDYDKRLADCINNGLFRKKRVRNYMKTNKLKKPTLVQKSDDNTLVLKGEVPVKTELVKNIPYQHQSLYIDKTR